MATTPTAKKFTFGHPKAARRVDPAPTPASTPRPVAPQAQTRGSSDGLVNPDQTNAMGAEDFFDVPESRTDPEPSGAPGRHRPSLKFTFAGAVSERDIYEGAAPTSAHDAQDYDDYLERGEAPMRPGIIARANEGQRRPDDVLAGFNLSHFRQVQDDPTVPPGSHYDAWQWEALDRDGFITIEVHVDAKMALESVKSTQPARPSPIGKPFCGETDMDEKDRAAAGIALDKEGAIKPAHDPFHQTHCLIHIPAIESAPWGRAKRVLLTPQTFRFQRVISEKDERYEMGRAQFNREPGTKVKLAQAIKDWLPEPKAVNQWLHKAKQNVLFGSCLVRGNKIDRTPDSYWMVLSQADVERYAKSLEADTDIDYERYHEEKSTDRWGRPVARQKLPDNRDCAPAERYWGEVFSEELSRALVHAANEGGFIPPEDWPEDDVKWWKEHGEPEQRASRVRDSEAEQENPVRSVEPMLAQRGMADFRPRMRG